MTEPSALAARVAHLERQVATLRARQAEQTGEHATVAARLDNIEETLVQHSAELATLTGGMDVLLEFARDHGRVLADHSSRLDALESRLDALESRLDAVERQLMGLTATVNEIAAAVVRIEARLGPPAA